MGLLKERNQEDRDRRNVHIERIAVDFLGEHKFCLYELTFAKIIMYKSSYLFIEIFNCTIIRLV